MSASPAEPVLAEQRRPSATARNTEGYQPPMHHALPGPMQTCICCLQVQAGASISRRVLVGSAGPAPGPSPGAPKDVRIDTASGFAATLVSGASGLAKQIVDR